MVDVTHPQLFDVTAANNLAARGNSVAEGWLPSVVNNWGRAFMSLIAGLYDDLSGQNTVGGTANAITVSGNIPLNALSEGALIAWQNSSGPNTGAATLNVDGLGAKAIRYQGDRALVGNELRDDGIYLARYDASANAAAGAWIVLNPSIAFGSYTPTLDNTTNVAASGAFTSYWFRTEDIITVWGVVTVDVTSSGVSTTLGISLPIASNFGAATDCKGVAAATTVTNAAGGISADSTNDRAILTYISNTTADQAFSFYFSYRII